MKFEINSEDVVKVTKLCKKVISSKSGLPVLSQIKVEVLPGKIFFSCTDLEMCLITTIECKTEGEGTFLLPFKAIEKVKSNGKVIVRYENSIEIQNSTGSVSIIPNDSEEFPMISKDEAQYMLGEDFLEKTAGCLPAVSSDESRSILNSVCIQKDAVLSTDGKRLHVFKTANPELFPGFNDSGIIVPAKTIKTLQAIAKLEKVKVLKIGGSTKTVPNSEEDSQSGISEPEDPQICEPLSVTFEIGNTILSSKVIDGIYPEWKNVIPQEVKSVVIIER
ncbi:MAG: DNA polymerase III subunit beta, partial [Elusimicrobiota bacterium]